MTNLKEFRKMTESELLHKLDEEVKASSQIGLDVVTGKEKDHSLVKKKRREIARLRTILSELKFLGGRVNE